jgi:DNA polymerase-3 subunit beta
MIVTVNSQRLAGELRRVVKVVPSKPAIPILAYVLLEAEDPNRSDDFAARLKFYATDLEVGFSTSCEAVVAESGKVALPAAKLLEMVEQFPDSDVIIEAGATVIIKCGAFRSRMQSLPTDDFPAEPTLEGEGGTVDGDSFRQLIARTRGAVTATATKHVLRGALLTLSGNAGAMIATDGKRLAMATTFREGKDMRVIIPAKALDMLASAEGENFEVTAGPRHLFFTSEGRMLTSRTIDGKFPAYERIIPRDNDKVVTVRRTDLSAALKRVRVAAEGSRAVRFKLEGERLELQASSAEVGTAGETVGVSYEGPAVKGCINGDYVLDFLEVASHENVTIALKDESSAALLTDGEDHLAVIMLMRG